MIVADTSVLVAAFASWHESHEVARRAVSGNGVIGHCLVEAYSVLTRLPPPHRVRPAHAAAFLAGIAVDAPLVLAPDAWRALPRALAEAGIAGGATYDALVATTALGSDAELVSLDARAVPTYRLIGVRHRLIG